MQLQRATSTNSPSPFSRTRRPERAGTISWRIHEAAAQDTAVNPIPSARKAASATITLLLHCVFVAVCHIIQYYGGYGIVALTFCAVHLSLLLGFYSPPPPGRAVACGVGWWVPSQVHEPFACLLLLAIGLVHYFGVGVIEFRTEKLACTANVEHLVRLHLCVRLQFLRTSVVSSSLATFEPTLVHERAGR